MSKQQLLEDNIYSPLAMEEIHINVHVYVAVEIALRRSMPASLQKCFAFCLLHIRLQLFGSAISYNTSKSSCNLGFTSKSGPSFFREKHKTIISGYNLNLAKESSIN